MAKRDGKMRVGIEQSDRLARELDWNLLRTFMVIVQEGGITAAANRLLLKQPTVSNALKRLEDRLGKRLIDRGPTHFRLTDAGEHLYRDVVEIYGSVARLAVSVRDIDDRIRGKVSIALASHVTFPPFDETIRAFSAAHPDVTYETTVATSAEVTAWVLEKRASFGICLVARQNPKLTYQHLYRQHFGFFCGPDHRFFGRRDVTLADLTGEPSVSFSTDQLHDALRPVALLRAQLNWDRSLRATSPHLEEVRRMIISGVGIGPLPVHVVTRDVEDGLLWRLPPYEDAPEIDIYLVTNPAARLNRAEQYFIEELMARVASIPMEDREYE